MTFRQNIALCFGAGLSLAVLSASEAALARDAAPGAAALQDRKASSARAAPRQPGVPTREEIMALMADRCMTR